MSGGNIAKRLAFEAASEELRAGTPLFHLREKIDRHRENEEYEQCAGIKMAIDQWQATIQNRRV